MCGSAATRLRRRRQPPAEARELAVSRIWGRRGMRWPRNQGRESRAEGFEHPCSGLARASGRRRSGWAFRRSEHQSNPPGLSEPRNPTRKRLSSPPRPSRHNPGVQIMDRPGGATRITGGSPAGPYTALGPRYVFRDREREGSRAVVRRAPGAGARTDHGDCARRRPLRSSRRRPRRRAEHQRPRGACRPVARACERASGTEATGGLEGEGLMWHRGEWSRADGVPSVLLGRGTRSPPHRVGREG